MQGHGNPAFSAGTSSSICRPFFRQDTVASVPRWNCCPSPNTPALACKLASSSKGVNLEDAPGNWWALLMLLGDAAFLLDSHHKARGVERCWKLGRGTCKAVDDYGGWLMIWDPSFQLSMNPPSQNPIPGCWPRGTPLSQVAMLPPQARCQFGSHSWRPSAPGLRHWPHSEVFLSQAKHVKPRGSLRGWMNTSFCRMITMDDFTVILHRC